MDRWKVINRIETICNICKENTWRTEFSSDTIYPLLSDALALLKEQPEIVRCKDCKRRGTYDCPVYVGGDGMSSEPDDWFCADAEPKESEQKGL